jgi:hypothetical protein
MELYSFNHLCTDKLSDDGILAFKPKNAYGKLNYAAEILAQKARKAVFGLKANIPSSDSLSVQKWIKLYVNHIHIPWTVQSLSDGYNI